MPNLCSYSMRVVGKKENVDEFIERMTDYEKPNHMWRIFDADVYDEVHNSDGTVKVDITGSCAWSIETCCRESGYSAGVDLFAVNTKDLHLKLEVYSEECGMCFQEHYLYDNGICEIDDCVEWISIYYDDGCYDSFEEWKEDNGIPESFEECDLDDGCCYTTGGYEDWSFVI